MRNWYLGYANNEIIFKSMSRSPSVLCRRIKTILGNYDSRLTAVENATTFLGTAGLNFTSLNYTSSASRLYGHCVLKKEL